MKHVSTLAAAGVLALLLTGCGEQAGTKVESQTTTESVAPAPAAEQNTVTEEKMAEPSASETQGATSQE